MFLELLDHPLISLLDRFTKFRPRYSDDGSQLSKILSTIEIPNFNRDELFNISSLIRKGKDVQTVLIPVYNLFKYNQNIVEKIFSLNVVPLNVSSNSYLTCSILMNVIGFLAERNKEKFSNFFHYVIDCIFLLKKAVNACEFNYLLYTSTESFAINQKVQFPSDLIPKIFSHASLDGFNAAVLLLSKLKHAQKHDLEPFLQNFILISISNSGEEICKYDFTGICSYLESYISEFDTNSMNILMTLASYREDSNIKDLFVKLPRFVFTKISESELQEFPKPLENKLTKFDTTSKGLELNLNIENVDTFPDGLVPPPAVAFETTKKFDDFLKPNNFMLASKIIQLLSCVLDCYNSAFFKSFAEYLNLHSDVQFYLIFIYILTHSRNADNDPVIFKALMYPHVFVPGLTIFNPSEGLELISFMRKTILSIFSTFFPNVLSNVLLNLCQHPFLFAETVGRIQTKLASFDLYDLTDEVSLSSIIEVISTLTSILMREKEMEKEVQQARSTLILFIFSLLDNQTMALRCFTSSVFACGFLSKITEKSMRDPMIHSLRQFLSKFDNPNVDILSPVCEFICGIIDMVRATPNGDDKLALDLLSSVNEASSHSKDISRVFRQLASTATNYLMTRPSELMLQATLQFFLQLSVNCKEVTLSFDEVQNLSNTAKIIEKTASEATLTCLINILARSKSTTADAMFFIQEPSVIILLFSVIESKSQVTKYLNMFLSLCSHCIYNCQMCHDGGLDSLLLEMVSHEEKEFTLRDCTFHFEIDDEMMRSLVFPLLKIICSCASSPQMPAKIIKQMIPVNGVFPKYSVHTMDLINSTISVLSTEPGISYRAGIINQYMTVEGLRVTDLAEGFSFSFMFNFDGPTAMMSNIRPLIFSITDIALITFQIFIRGDSLLVRVIKGNDSSSIATLCQTLPSGSWHRCTTSISFYEDNIAAIVFNIDEKKDNYYSVTFPNFERNELYLQFGGIAEITDDSDLSDFACLISNFKLYGYARSQEGSSIVSSKSSSSATITSNETLKLLFPQSQSQLKIDASHVNKSSFPYTLFDAFKEEQNIKLLIPLFNFTEKMPPHFISQLIDTITCIVTSSSKIEEQFDSVPLITRFLSRSPVLNYTIFNKLVSFFFNCSTKRLISELLEFVIFNIDLWVRSDAQSLQKIAQYWSTLSGYEQIRIRDVIPKIRIHFWYEPIEVELINKCRDPKVDIELIRYNFNKLLVELPFSKQDFLIIASHCSTCADQKQVNDFLGLLIDLTTKNPDVISPVYCKCVFPIFKPKQNKRFMLILKLICNISGSKLFEYLLITTEFIGVQYVDKSLFKEVLEFQKLVPEVYVMSTWMAQNLDEECREEVAMSLRELDISRISKNKFWYIPFILLMLSSGPEARALINVFFSKILKENYSVFYELEMSLRVLCYTGNYDVDSFIKPLLFIYPITDVKRSIRILLYHVLFHVNEDLHSELLESSAFSFHKETKKKEEKQQIITIFNIRDFLQENSMKTPSFRIRINDEMFLKDLDLMTMIIEHKHEVEDNQWINYFELLIAQSNGDRINMIKRQLLQDFQSFVETTLAQAMKEVNEMKQSIAEFFHFSVENLYNTQSLITIATQNIADVENNTNLLITKDAEDSFASRYVNDASVWSSLDQKLTVMRDPFMFNNVMQMPRLCMSVVQCFSGPALPKDNFTNEKPVYETECHLVDVNYEEKVVFSLFKEVLLIRKPNKTISIPLNKSTLCLPRRRYQIPNSVEIFHGNRSYLIDFSPNTNAKAMNELEKNTRKVDFKKIKEDWCSGNLSNFNYLMSLNLISGRSFHDTLIYPIFPWLFFADGERNLELPVAGAKSSIIDRSPLSPASVNKYLGRIHPFDPNGCFSSEKEASDSARSLSTYSELTPEFFFSPDYFRGFVDHPYDFVLRNRKKLESPEVSASINKWIDMIFGACTNTSTLFKETVWEEYSTVEKSVIIKAMSIGGQMPASLFTEPHPQRRIIPRTSLEEKHLKLPVKFAYANFSGFVGDSAVFHVISNDNLLCVSASYETKNVTCETIRSKFNYSPDCKYASHDSSFVTVDTKNCSVQFVSMNGKKLIHFRKPALFSSDANIFAVANATGLIKVMDHEFVSTTDEIISMTISSSYNIIVVGTIERKIISYDLSCRFLFSASIEALPLSITVTKSMGTIIVHCKNALYAFTVNGTLIAKLSLASIVVKHIVCVESLDGDDKVFFVDDKGCFREFHVSDGNPSSGNTFFNCHGDVACVGSNPARNILVALKSDASLYFIPF